MRKSLLKIIELVLDDLLIYIDLCKTFDNVPCDIQIISVLPLIIWNSKIYYQLENSFLTRLQVISLHLGEKKKIFVTLEFYHSADYRIYSLHSAKLQNFFILHCCKNECLYNVLILFIFGGDEMKFLQELMGKRISRYCDFLAPLLGFFYMTWQRWSNNIEKIEEFEILSHQCHRKDTQMFKEKIGYSFQKLPPFYWHQ